MKGEIKMGEINNLSDLKQLLRQYGLVVYMGNWEDEKAIMKDELKEMLQLGLIDRETFRQANTVLIQYSKR